MNELQDAAHALLILLEPLHGGRSDRLGLKDDCVGLYDALAEDDDDDVAAYMDKIVSSLRKTRWSETNGDYSYAEAYDLDLTRQREALKAVAA